MMFLYKIIPLSVAGVSLGAMLAAADYHVDFWVAFFLVLTAALLQILAERKSKPLIALTSLSGMAMLFFSFGTLFCMESLLMMVIGYFVIRTAVKGTGVEDDGKYRWLRYVYSFFIYGLVAVYASYGICSHAFATWIVLLPAVSVGLLCVSALTMDRKMPIAGRAVPVVLGWCAMLVYASLRMFDPWHYLFVLALPLYIWYLVGAGKNPEKASGFYQTLASVSVLAFAVLGGLGFLVYLF